MQWWIALLGLLMLAGLAFGVRKRPASSYRDVPLEDELASHIATLAARTQLNGHCRLRLPSRLLGIISHRIAYLNRRPLDELLPGARWLSDNGRFLQETIVSLRMALRSAPTLPRTTDGESRLLRIAREMVGHSNADVNQETITRIVEAWQQQEALTTNELCCLPLAIKTVLIGILTEMTERSQQDQRAYDLAPRFAEALLAHPKPRIPRRFARYQTNATFLERLLSILRACEDAAAIDWLEHNVTPQNRQLGEIAELEHGRQTENCLWISNAITSLRAIDRMPWHRLIERFSRAHEALCADNTYPQMDEESRAYYRECVVCFSKAAGVPELTVCDAALSLCRPGDEIDSHVGYYLLDDGRSRLLTALHCKRLAAFRLLFGQRYAFGLFRLGEWLVFLGMLAVGWRVSLSPWLWLPFAALAIPPYHQLWRKLASLLLRPRMLPRILVERLSDDERTLVVCPTLLQDREQALSMAKRLSVLHQANPDRNLEFLLLGDPRESLTESMIDDDEIIRTAAASMQALREETGHSFQYIQRNRVLNVRDHSYHSRERKRGGLDTLLRLIDGRPVDETFAYSSCPPSALAGQYRYVITLDSDTLLPPGSALRMVGAMLHPLQKRCMFRNQMRGVSVLQPRMEISASSIGSYLSLYLCGRGGADPYNTFVSDLWQDARGRGSYVGKGIIDPKAFLNALEGKLIPNAILSHDLLEGEIAGCAVASDIRLYDSQPSTLKAYLGRLHRWTRGDWQLLPYVLPAFPLIGKAPAKALDALAKHKLWANLFRSVVAPLKLILIFLAVALGEPWLLIYALLSDELVRLAPYRDGSAWLSALLRFLTLPCAAYTQVDAIARTLWRLFVSRRNLLQWTTASQLSKPSIKPSMLYFNVNMGAAVLMAAFFLLPTSLSYTALAVALYWACFSFAIPMLERSYAEPPRVTDFMREELTRIAQNTLQFFETIVTPGENHLPPDNVQLEPNKGVAHRTSPTNIGLYIVSLLSAEKLGLLRATDAVTRIGETLRTLENLPLWNGLPYNWYDTKTLQAMNPPFISSVDCGNLAVCLLTAAQGVRVLWNELPPELCGVSARLDGFARGMQLDRLYDTNAELFYIGVYPDQPQADALSHYDLLASESRLLSYAAILLEQAPVRHWYRLGRSATKLRRGCTLVSYSGTMFEYAMPLLFLPAVKGTLLEQACRQTFREQSRHRWQGVFGVSESGYYSFDPELNYQYKAFGIPALALDPTRQQDVVAPYATALTLSLELKRSFLNLRRLQALGIDGLLGFFEAADFRRERGRSRQTMRVVRSHMAHHQGMILCAICNALCEDYIVRLFIEPPRAKAFELLLEEKPLSCRQVLRRPLKRRLHEEPIAPLRAHRVGNPQFFPVDAQLLHGAGTTLLLDANGGGYVSRNGIMLTRFREQCRIPSGIRYYLRDSQSGAYWQTTDPTIDGNVAFETAQCVFSRQKLHVESTMRVFVNPLDGTVLSLITLENRSPADRMLELCSYVEPSLTTLRDDEAHPAFQNLFIRTSRFGTYGVMATRRPRKENETSRTLLHTLVCESTPSTFRVQTDRVAFLGRNGSVFHPVALTMPISAVSDSVGDVIDPCLSLRAQFVLPANGRVRFLFATLLASAQDTPSAFAERYATPESAEKVYELSLTQGLVTAKYLGLDANAQNAAARLIGCLAYTDQPHQTRYPANNRMPISELWGLGVSGEYPVLVAQLSDERDLSMARLLLKAHAYFRLSGFWTDLVFISNQLTGYAHPLRDALSELMQASHSRELVGQKGGLHLLERQSMSDETYALLLACARLVLYGEKGSTDEQLKAMLQAVKPTELDYPKLPIDWSDKPFTQEKLLYDNSFGGFSPADGSYVISLPPYRNTPAPWSNVLASPAFGSIATESGIAFTYADNSHDGRLTRWSNDACALHSDENFFLKDDDHHLLWSVTRWPLGQCLRSRVTHEPGATCYECRAYGILQKLTVFTDSEASLGIRALQLKNEDTAERKLRLYYSCTFSMANQPTADQLTQTYRKGGTVYAIHPSIRGVACLSVVNPTPTLSTTMSAGAFFGLFGDAPAALSTSDALPCDTGNTGVVCVELTLKPSESALLTCAIGFGSSQDELARALASLRSDGASLRLHLTKLFWERELSGLRFDLPDPALSLMMNRWLPYQVRASRLFARAGFYQAGGAIGFRDQLQDMLSQLFTAPSRVRAHLLLCAAHQFEEGDVQHWWHPPQRGVRTRISDDLLFLPYLTAQYVQTTGDTSVLQESVPYLRSDPLAQGEKERYDEPETSELVETLHQHCLRAIRRVAYGAHGLPLMLGGDWNDGMNAVGGENGESVWLGMFLCEVLRRYIPFCDAETSQELSDRYMRLLSKLDQYAWDGAWYLRAWYDNGEPLGGNRSDECRIDLLPQCWAVLSGLSRERSAVAMEAVWQTLYEKDIGILKLFAPPFDGRERPGYIAGYLPGVRENGGQYTHSVPWAIAALHQLGHDSRAWQLTNAVLPIRHAETRQQALRYRVEPYVMAGDVYANPERRGRGGWTWYTGSASWLYFIVINTLFGFQKTGNSLRLQPFVPPDWDGLTITYQYGSATYHLHASKDCPYPTADGEKLRDGRLLLIDDGRIHEASFPIRDQPT